MLPAAPLVLVVDVLGGAGDTATALGLEDPCTGSVGTVLVLLLRKAIVSHALSLGPPSTDVNYT